MPQNITKIDAARRQLLAAIHLHWYLDEPLAVYTLAANAWEISDALLKKLGRLRLVEAFQKTHGEPEKAFRGLINRPRNYIKHADWDSDAILPELASEDVDTVIMIACVDYAVLSGRQPLIFDMFLSWYAALYPEKVGDFYRTEADRLFPNLAKTDRRGQLIAARFIGNQVDTTKEFHRARSEMTDNFRWAKLRKWSASS